MLHTSIVGGMGHMGWQSIVRACGGEVRMSYGGPVET